MDVPQSPRSLGLNYRKWRHGQREAIEHINQSDKPVILLEAPTGFGKSLLAAALIRMHRGDQEKKISGRSLVLTRTTHLMDQYIRDFPWMQAALGKELFRCVLEGNEKLPVSKAPCQTGWSCPEYRNHTCPYFVQRSEAFTARTMVTTYAKALTSNLGHRGLMICDEGHMLERQLLTSFSIRLPFDELKALGMPVPAFGSIDEAAIWASGKVPRIEFQLEAIQEILKALVQKKQYQTGRYAKDPAKDQFFRLRNILNPLKALANADTSALWSMEPYKQALFLRPIWAADHAHKLFKIPNRLIVQSATIMDGARMAQILGIKTRNYEYITIPSTFDASRRPIYYWPIVKLGMRSGTPEIRRLVAAIDRLLDHYPKRRGIIHSVNWTLTDYIQKLSRHRKRLIVQPKGKGRSEGIDKFLKTPHSVLVSPSVTTGLDGKFELARFQIIAKMPFENQGEQAIADRLDEDHQWYAYQAAFHIQQAAGRVMRDEMDYGETWILDANFEWFYRQNRSLFSTWFSDALSIRRGP